MLTKAPVTCAEVAHLAYLTPPHKRKGKGGRQPAADPRLDPNIDPKRARRILANRLSAARSKMKQKSHVDVRGPLVAVRVSVMHVLLARTLRLGV